MHANDGGAGAGGGVIDWDAAAAAAAGTRRLADAAAAVRTAPGGGGIVVVAADNRSKRCLVRLRRHCWRQSCTCSFPTRMEFQHRVAAAGGFVLPVQVLCSGSAAS